MLRGWVQVPAVRDVWLRYAGVPVRYFLEDEGTGAGLRASEGQCFVPAWVHALTEGYVWGISATSFKRVLDYVRAEQDMDDAIDAVLAAHAIGGVRAVLAMTGGQQDGQGQRQAQEEAEASGEA